MPVTLLPDDEAEVIGLEPEAPPDTTSQAGNYCACGCGSKVSYGAEYKRGHRPKVETSGSSKGGSVRSWSSEDIAVFTTAIVMLLLALTSSLEQTIQRAVSMSLVEAEAIGGPAARILARHIKIPSARQGDVADASALVAGIFAYSMRVYVAMKEAPKHDSNNQPITPTYGSNFPISGLEAYQYRPPQQENGTSAQHNTAAGNNAT